MKYVVTGEEMNKQKYVITALNTLTGERDVISSPHHLTKAREMLVKRQREMRGKRCLPFTRLKLEPAEREGSLW